jgi:cytochrome c oxidase subunit II
MRAPRHSFRLSVVLSIVCGSLVLAACGENLPATTLYPAGTHAQRIYDLMVPIFWAALGVFVVVEGMLVYSVFRFRQRSESDPMPAQIHGNTRIEIMWTIAPALILLVIAVLTFRTQAENSVQPADGMKIQIVGHQWWWEFKYPDSKVVTANDVYIPTGQDIQFQMTSADVIHDPWMPKLAGKTDAIPGHTTFVSFRTDKPGIYRGLCAEFCGTEHAVMRFRVIAVAPDVFQNWLQQHQQPVGPAIKPATTDSARLGSGDPARGEKAFLNVKNLCITCHAIGGYKEAVGVVGPNLTYFGSRETIGAGALLNTPENLKTWIHNPGGVKPKNTMSTVIKEGMISDQDINDIVAFLESQTIAIDKPGEQ